MLESKKSTHLTEKEDDDYLKSSEMKVRNKEAKTYDEAHLNKYHFYEVVRTVNELRAEQNSQVLDLGSGTGIITEELLKRGCSVVAVDFANESLKILKNKCWNRAEAICADICFLPLNQSSFDRVISCEVFEHLPSEASRTKAIREVSRILEPGGVFVLTVYNWGLKQRMILRRKEGYHGAGTPRITYFCFNLLDIRRLLVKIGGFSLDKLVYIVNVPYSIAVKTGSFSVYLERLLSALPFSIHLAYLILAAGTKGNSKH